MPDDGPWGASAAPPPPVPPYPSTPPPLSPPPGRPRRRWVWPVVVGVLVVWLGGGALLTLQNRERIESDLVPDCPTGRVTAQVASFTPTLSAVGDPTDGVDLFQLEVEFEVTNDSSAAVFVTSVQVGMAGDPASVVSGRGVGQELASGRTDTSQGSAMIQAAGPVGPTPDPGTLVVDARWADEDLLGCHPPL